MSRRETLGEAGRRTASEIVLGIDGGWSKTRGVLMLGTGETLAECATGGSAIIGLPSARSVSTLRSCIRELCSKAGIARKDIASVGLGLNGIDFADELDAQAAALAKGCELRKQQLTLVNDGVAALWGASVRPAAAIVQHGSGITTAFRTAYGNERLFDNLDVGRMFDLRTETIASVARMIDGRIPTTALKDAVLAHLGVSEERDYSEMVYRKQIPAEKIQTVHLLVYDAWQRGDPAASVLVQRAIDDYRLCAAAMVSKMGNALPDVAFGGGVIGTAPEVFFRSLRDAVLSACPHAAVKRPDLPPHFGAAIMAAFRTGADAEALFEKILERRSTSNGVSEEVE